MHSHGRLLCLILVLAETWVPDDVRKKCLHCHQAFNPVFRRKHHCRGCGEVFCDTCTQHRFSSHRVCLQCYLNFTDSGRYSEVNLLKTPSRNGSVASMPLRRDPRSPGAVSATSLFGGGSSVSAVRADTLACRLPWFCSGFNLSCFGGTDTLFRTIASLPSRGDPRGGAGASVGGPRQDGRVYTRSFPNRCTIQARNTCGQGGWCRSKY